MKKLKIIIAILMPIIFGISGCYILTMKLLEINYNMMGNSIADAVYSLFYYLLFIPFTICIGIGSLIHILPLVHQLRYKFGIILLSIVYLALLVVLPHVLNHTLNPSLTSEN